MENRYEAFTVLLNRISRSIHRIKVREMSEFNLRSAHTSCLYHLYYSDGLTAVALCEKCAEDKAAISRALDQLESEGYITCQLQQSRRYKTPVMLTEKGRNAGKRIAQKVDDVLSQLDRGMSEKERLEMYRHLNVLCQELEKIASKAEQVEQEEV